MKVVVKVVGEGARVEVSAGALPRYLERREMDHMLAWAEERGLKYVEWMYPFGRVTVTRCRDCGQPIQNICGECQALRSMAYGPDRGELSAEELEYRAQFAERMATRYAQMAIDLQARAAAAASDPIEVTEVSPAQLGLASARLDEAVGAELDHLAELVCITRVGPDGLYPETDEALRERVRAFVDTSKSEIMVVNMATAASLKPGDRLMVNTQKVVVLDVCVRSSHSTVRYRAI